MDKKIKSNIKDNYPIYLILIISLILNIAAMINLGYKYTLGSDDLSYIESGITFLKEGKITMHGVISAQIMPGMTYIISLFAFIFGTKNFLWLSLKIAWIIMGVATIYIVYKSIRLYCSNKFIAIIPCLFFLSADYIWMNNIILTETPYILLFSLLIYHTLKLSQKQTKKDYILTIIYYICALLIRPNIALFPIFMIIFLILKKYNIKMLIKQCLIALCIVLVVIIPWTYRNYKLFETFIPLTYGTGNPLLLGTYQGIGYPTDEELDYETNLDKKLPKKMAYYLNEPTQKQYMKRYYLLEYDKIKAKYRMKEWWNKDKKSMIKSYLYLKPKSMLWTTFYWKTIFNIPEKVLVSIRKIEFILFILASITIIFDKNKIKEWVYLILLYVSQLALYSYTFSFSRYAISIYFMRYIIIGIALNIVYNRLIKIKKENYRK